MATTSIPSNLLNVTNGVPLTQPTKQPETVQKIEENISLTVTDQPAQKTVQAVAGEEQSASGTKIDTLFNTEAQTLLSQTGEVGFSVTKPAQTDNADIYGFYIKDQNAIPIGGQVIWSNTQDTRSHIADIYGANPADLGFFVIPNGAEAAANLEDGAAVSFQKDQNGNWLAVTEAGKILKGQDGIDIQFSNANLNAGRQKSLSLIETAPPQDQVAMVAPQVNPNLPTNPLLNAQMSTTPVAQQAATQAVNSQNSAEHVKRFYGEQKWQRLSTASTDVPAQQDMPEPASDSYNVLRLSESNQDKGNDRQHFEVNIEEILKSADKADAVSGNLAILTGIRKFASQFLPPHHEDKNPSPELPQRDDLLVSQIVLKSLTQLADRFLAYFEKNKPIIEPQIPPFVKTMDLVIQRLQQGIESNDSHKTQIANDLGTNDIVNFVNDNLKAAHLSDEGLKNLLTLPNNSNK